MLEKEVQGKHKKAGLQNRKVVVVAWWKSESYAKRSFGFINIKSLDDLIFIKTEELFIFNIYLTRL